MDHGDIPGIGLVVARRAASSAQASGRYNRQAIGNEASAAVRPHPDDQGILRKSR